MALAAAAAASVVEIAAADVVLAAETVVASAVAGDLVSKTNKLRFVSLKLGTHHQGLLKQNARDL